MTTLRKLFRACDTEVMGEEKNEVSVLCESCVPQSTLDVSSMHTVLEISIVNLKVPLKKKKKEINVEIIFLLVVAHNTTCDERGQLQ